MPTGYTSKIHDGESLSAKEYLLRCARNFGALIMMRDEPLDKEIPEFQPSEHHLDAVKRAKADLKKYQTMSINEVEKLIGEQYKQELERHKKYLKEKTDLLYRYNLVLKEVEAWNPPSKDHENLKQFAVDQLKESINWDCDVSYISAPKKQNATEWLEARIKSCERDIDYHTREYDEEAKRTNERNEWVRLLKESLQ